MANSFIENINTLASKLDIIIESNGIFDEGVIPVLEEIAALDLDVAVADLKKGNYLGNRKIDIDLSLNVQGITLGMDPNDAETIWTAEENRVTYSSCDVTFVDGIVVHIPFVFDGNPVSIQTHGDLLIQLNANAEFLAKLEDTSIAGFSALVVGEIVRFYDVTGTNSNIERIKLNADSGPYIEEQPIYYWAKTTSAFETLAMRAGDVIKLGNEIDNLILLANKIEQVIELRDRIPEFIDTYTDGVANGDLTIYNKLTELDAIYAELIKVITVYEDIKVGGNNYINTLAVDLQDVNSDVITVSTDLKLGASSNVSIVSGAIANVNNVGNNIGDVESISNNMSTVQSIATNIIPNLAEILLADDNAATATAKAAEASLSATNAANSATIATTKANEIKNVSVASTVTGAAGTNAAVTYNSTDGKFTFIVPQGIKGDKGDSFEVNAVGLLSQKSLYDNQQQGFSFLAIDEATIYFKLSATSGDWSVGAPFGKGETGATGAAGNGIADIVFTSTTDSSGVPGVGGATDTYTITYTDTTTDTFVVYNGNGIVSIVFTSTTDDSGLPAQSGATDTYTITYTDATTSTFTVYNGIDSAVQSVAGRTGNVILAEADITDLDKYTQAEVDTLLASKPDKTTTYTKEEVDGMMSNTASDIDCGGASSTDDSFLDLGTASSII